jgi:hypothetical protein
MLLREIFYFDKNDVNTADHKMYDPEHDQSIIGTTDTRKTKFTLKQINRARKASEFHNNEQQKELEFVRNMYSIASTQPTA